MTTFALGVVLGTICGLLLPRLRVRVPKLRRTRTYSVIPLDLNQEELDDINRRYAESVTTQREARDQQVGQYADRLAEQDPLLRERLRRFERGAAT